MTDFDPALLAELTLSDKKTDGDNINLIVPLAIGNTVIHRIPKTEILDFIKAGQ